MAAGGLKPPAISVRFRAFFEMVTVMDARRAWSAALRGQPAQAILSDLKVLAKLASPVVISRLGIMAMGLTDTLVVGRYSAVQLGYIALGWAPTSVFVVVTVSLLSGIPVMTSRAMGEGKPHLAGAVLRRGLVYAFMIGAAGTAILLLFGPAFLHAVGLERSLAGGASRVMVILALSMIPNALSNALSQWLEAIRRPTPAMTMMWLANAVNLAVDLMLVPGHPGVPALGAVGAGFATLGARTFLTLALALYVVRMPDARALGVFDKPARDVASETEQRRVGYGAGASGFFEVAAFSGMNIIAGWVGPLGIAAYTVALNVVSVAFMIPLGLATAAGVLVGNAYGARKPRDLNRAAGVSFGVTAAFGTLVTLAVWPTAALIASGYTHDPQAGPMATAALILCCLFLIPDALQVVAAQCLRARGDVFVPSVTHFISYVGVMIPAAYLFAIRLHAGINGIIWAAIVASLLSASLLLGRFWILRGRDLPAAA